jgi:non-ribosomal peptide synthetase component F
MSEKAYWKKQLSGEIPILNIPGKRLRPKVKTYVGGRVVGVIPKEQTAALNSLFHDEGCTLFMGLVTVVNSLLYRYTGSEDIIIGSPIAGREHSDLEDQIGFYVNTLPLRTQFNGAVSFKELLNKVKRITLDAYDHQSYPFEALVDELNLRRDMSRSALFDVLVDFRHSINALPDNLEKLAIRTCNNENYVSKFDLTFFFTHIDGQVN